MAGIVIPPLSAVTLTALGLGLSLTSPAFAGISTPAPIVGAGLPVLAIVGGAYWLYRRYHNRRPGD